MRLDCETIYKTCSRISAVMATLKTRKVCFLQSGKTYFSNIKIFQTPLYTAHLWTNYSCLALKNFYIAYHNVMKLFIGLPKREHNRPLCVTHRIPYGPALMRNYIYKFLCRLDRSENKILYTINNSDCKYESHIRKKWRSLLYI